MSTNTRIFSSCHNLLYYGNLRYDHCHATIVTTTVTNFMPTIINQDYDGHHNKGRFVMLYSAEQMSYMFIVKTGPSNNAPRRLVYRFLVRGPLTRPTKAHKLKGKRSHSWIPSQLSWRAIITIFLPPSQLLLQLSQPSL